MRVVPLSNAPNQSFTVTIDGTRWGVRLVAIGEGTAADVSRDGVEILRGVRVVAGEPIIPYKYLVTGNFLFITEVDQMPVYSAFGVSQTLVYLSPDEIAALAVSPLSASEILPFTASYLTSDGGFYLTTDTGSLLTDD